MVQTTNLHAIPVAAPGQLTAVDLSALPVAKALEIPRLLNSAEPPPVQPPTLYDHGIGTRFDSKQ